MDACKDILTLNKVRQKLVVPRLTSSHFALTPALVCLQCQFVVDTGTSILTGPTKHINNITAKIGDVASDCSNIDSLPDIAITLVRRAIAHVCRLRCHGTC